MNKATILGVTLLGALPATLALAASSSTGARPEPSDVPAAEFARIHSATAEDPNRFLVLGGVRSEPAPAGLSGDLKALLGRWEGFNTNPPVKKDLKIALAIERIDDHRADAVICYGYDLQFPKAVKRISFEVKKGDGVSLDAALEPGATRGVTLRVQPGSGALTGDLVLGSGTANYVGSQSVNTVELRRGSAFHVYRDFPAYLASLGIHPETYRNPELNRFGNGYLVYLPPGYEADTGRKWPLMLYMHGMGDRGDNVLLLAKASPLKMIREKGPLPFIIVSPLLSGSPDFFSFPGKYLEGVLDEVSKRYRVDEKRVYLSGLSLGGEAAFRFSLEHPERIAAMASLGGVFARHVPAYYPREIKELTGIPLSRLAEVPAWQIHGAGDAIVPVQLARMLVDEFARAGVKVKYTELADHEHDVWNDTFADPAFYDWFLQYAKR